MTHSFWSEDREQALRLMAARGASSREIAEELGCTKNAVIGRCHSIGISLKQPHGGARRVERPVEGKPPRAHHIVRKVAVHPPRTVVALPPPEEPPSVPIVVIPEPPATYTGPVTLMDLPASGACRYPLGNLMSCAKPVGRRADGLESVYCQQHHDACHQKLVRHDGRREFVFR